MESALKTLPFQNVAYIMLSKDLYEQHQRSLTENANCSGIQMSVEAAPLQRSLEDGWQHAHATKSFAMAAIDTHVAKLAELRSQRHIFPSGK